MPWKDRPSVSPSPRRKEETLKEEDKTKISREYSIEDEINGLKDIISELKETHDNYEIVIDRREAIQKAIDMAKEKDMVLILGKGNETYEKLKTETIYFNDIEEAYQAVDNRKKREESR